MNVVFVPVSRDELGPALVDGRGDVAFASIVVTPERQKIVDFAAPSNTGVSEIVVTGPNSPKIATLDDLAGQEVFVRPNSIYYEGLVRLNEDFKKRGKAAIVLKPAPVVLEDEDLLEMLNAGLVKAVVVYSHLAQFWKQIFPRSCRTRTWSWRRISTIAPAIRKNSPLLKAELDTFVKTHGKGTAFGNIVVAKYMKNATFVKKREQRCRQEALPRHHRPVPEVQRQVRRRLAADGGAGLPGVRAQPERQEPGRRRRRHAGHARDGQGAQGRRHHASSSRTSTPA